MSNYTIIEEVKYENRVTLSEMNHEHLPAEFFALPIWLHENGINPPVLMDLKVERVKESLLMSY